MSGGFRVSSTIPSNVKKTIQNIREITGNHSDEEIYAMLRDCAMDPNETTQKLLHQDTFHEVKRKKDRKKESQTSQDIGDSRWRPGPAGRGGRGGRGNHTSPRAEQDGVGRSIPAKENVISQASDKIGSFSTHPVQETKKKDGGSSVTEMLNYPVNVDSRGTKGANASGIMSEIGTSELEPQIRRGGSKRSNTNVESIKLATFSDAGSNGTHVCAAVGTIKRDVGSQSSHMEPNSNISSENKSNAGKTGGKSLSGKNQSAESLQSLSLSHGSSSRPSSNYGNRLQQALGSQKVGPNKEWKPKVTNTNTVQGLQTSAAPEGSNIQAETCVHSESVESEMISAGASKLEKELEGLNVKEAQNVIIPNHIHVPDAVRTGLNFGSFDATFVIASKSSSESETDNSKSVSETEQGVEAAEEDSSQSTLAPGVEADNTDSPQSPKQMENLSAGAGDVSVAANLVPEFSDPKEQVSEPQHSSVHTSASYNLGLLPPMLGSPLGSQEASETQAHHASKASSFVVQQPVDPSSFYAQFDRSGADSDGRVSPSPSHGAASKYNGNVSPSLSPTEGGNPLILSTAAQPLANQGVGVMPNSIAVTQQPMPLFRQPAGVHIPHYPPSYFPYGHYLPPFYVPPPAMHQFLGNNAYPQQGQAGNVYPAQPAPAAAPTAVKFPMSQYKPTNNPGNSMHMGIVGGYGPYGASPAGYNPVSASTAGNSAANEDLAASQFKESNLYMTGQQSEGSAVWIPAPGRDIGNIPANSFYNLPPQGQHVTFAPTQGGQGTFAGIYHPFLQQSQAMPGAVDMTGATANVYQQSQHAQMNWQNNY